MFSFLRSSKKTRKSRPAAPVRRFVRRLPLYLERLENRIMLAADNWIAGSGNWDDASNWSLGNAPGIGDTAIINTTSAATITIQSGDNIQVQSVTTGSNDTLSITGGSLTVTSGTSALNGPSSITGGTLTANAAITFTGNSEWDGGTIEATAGITIATSSKITLPVSANVTLSGTVTNDGVIQLNGSAAANPNVPLTIGGDTTLEGTGQLILDSEGGRVSLVLANGVTLTNAAGHTIRGSGNVGDFGSGTVVNKGLIESDVAGQTLSFYSSALSNSGTLEATNGATLNFFKAPVDNSAGVIKADASTVVVNSTSISGGTLDLTNGSTLSANGGLVNVTFSAESHLVIPSGSNVSFSGTITNNGMIELEPTTNYVFLTANGNVTFAGTGQVQADAGGPISGGGNYSSIFGVANAGDTLTNAAGQTMRALNGDFAIGYAAFNGPGNGTVINDGLMIADGGTLGLEANAKNAGTVEALDNGDVFLRLASTLDNSGGKFVVSGAGSISSASGGLALDSSSGQIVVSGGTLDGTDSRNFAISNASLDVTGDYSITGTVALNNIAIPAGGVLDLAGISGQTISGTLTAEGTLSVSTGTGSVGSASLEIDGSGVLVISPAATLQVGGNLLGQTQNAQQFAPQGTVVLNGSGTSTTPQLMEVMSQDLGNVAAGFLNNFAYGTLALANNTYVQLVDNAKNSAGSTGPEALYANTLVVPAGCTLDLHGLHAYTRVIQVAGTIVGGTVTQIQDGGQLSFDTPAAGVITSPSQVDDWTFYGRSGQKVAVVVNTGSQSSIPPVPPTLKFAQVQILDPSGHVVASGANTQSGADVLLQGITLTSDGTYTVQVQVPANQSTSTGDYGVSVWNAPVNNYALNVGQHETGQLENQYSEDHWSFYGVANEQVQFQFLNASSSAVQFDLTGPSGFTGGFSNQNGSSGLITLTQSGTYVVTAHMTGFQAGAYAFQLNETSQTPLSLGTQFQGTLATSGQAQLFTVTVAKPGALSVILTDANASDENEVYVSFGTAPTRDIYQYRFAGTGANQTLALSAQAGTYYILVYNNLVNTPGSNYSLLVQGGPFVLTGITPGQVGTGQDSTLIVSGVFPQAYQSSTAYQVQFVTAGGTVYPTSSPMYLSPTSLGSSSPGNTNANGTMTMSATLPANTLPAGTYSVRITDSAGDPPQMLPNALTVTAGGTGMLQTSISAPNPIGNHQPAVIYVKYTNVGTAPMAAPLLVLTATRNGQQGAFLSLDPSLAGLGYTSSTTPAGFSPTVQFLASGDTPGILQPGESVTVPVYYSGWLNTNWGPPIVFSLGELDTTNTQPIDWSSIQAGLRPGSINQAAWNAMVPTLTAALGSTWGQYVQTLDTDAVYLAGIGEPTTDLSQLLSFEIEKANAAYTAQTLTSVTADSLPAPGMDLTFVQSFQQSISGRYTSGILGFGWTTNWDISATTMTNGDVVINNDGVSLYFSLQPNGSFAPQAGDQGTTLTASGGAYMLTEPDGTVYQFNANGTLNYLQDTHGNRITAGYNAQGQLISLTHSNGEYLHFAYNGQGHLSTLTDSNGQTETYGYDPTGQFLTSYTDAYGTTNYTYVTGSSPAQNNALDSITNASNTQLNFVYDAQGRLIEQFYATPNGKADDETINYLNPGGYVTTDANGNKTTVYFNLFGASAETMDALGNVTRYYFDANLNMTKVIGPGGATYAYSYDKNGNLLNETDPLGLTTAFTYDAHNNLTGYTDAKGNTTQYAYNANNDLLSITYANGTQQQYSYNPLGEATQFVNARGQAIGYTYNAQGLVATETFADGTSFTYTYDARGNLTSATDAQGKVTKFVYSNANNPDLLTEVDYPNGHSLKFSYNIIGQRIQSVDDTGFTVNYSYDALGRLSELTDANGNLIVQYTYDKAGNLIQKDMGNGTRTVYTYDKAGNVLTITNHASANGSVNSFDDYTYDPLSNVLTDTNQDGEWVYTYDADSQLTGAVFTPNSTDPDKLTAQNLQYVYDAAGNRESETVNGVTTTYVVNNVNEYTSSTTNGVTTAYQYDADGNLIAQTTPSGTTDYSFNELNQLTAINGGVKASYGYDPLGNRVSQTINGVTTHFQIDPAGLGNVVATLDSTGALTAHYAYGLGLVSQVSATGAAGYYDFNNIGSTVGITGTSGSYVNDYAYLPFGQTISVSSTVSNPFMFVAQFGVRNDGTAVLDMGARTYDPTSGRFLSSDPIGLLGGSTNLRSYTGNCPTTNTDPTGTKCSDVDPVRVLNILASLYVAVKLHLIPTPPGPLTATAIKAILKQFLVKLLLGPEVAEAESAGDLLTSPMKVAVGFFGAGEVAAKATPETFWSLGPQTRQMLIQLYREACPCMCPSPQQPMPPQEDTRVASVGTASSIDPNSMEAPSGDGAQNFVAADALLPYQINFENDPSATAPAQRVDISDPLAPNFDWSTLRLTAVGFGSTYISIPAGLQHYATTVSVTENGQTFNVVISLNLNPATGVLTASFQSIDPSTDLPPTSLLTGFLPPEDGSGRGIGFVSFTVSPKAGLANGTQITNVAQIAFDQGQTIATDQKNDEDPTQGIDPTKQALVTIDSAPPTSSVTPLPAIVNSPSFTVNWSGSQPNGPGIASYNIYVSDNGGAFTPWLVGTTLTSATYTGQVGHHYSFYSVAADPLGLTQPTPTSAQATTYVFVPAPSPAAPPPSPPSAPPTLQVPPLLAFLDSILGGIETINSNGTETITDSIFGIPLIVATFNGEGGLQSVTLFGINITFLFE